MKIFNKCVALETANGVMLLEDKDVCEITLTNGGVVPEMSFSYDQSDEDELYFESPSEPITLVVAVSSIQGIKK